MGTKRGKMRTLTCASCGETKSFRGFDACENGCGFICVKCQRHGCKACMHDAPEVDGDNNLVSKPIEDR